jgi:signal transduction histidine kinase
VRSRLLASSVAIALIAAVLLGLPLAIVGGRLLGEQARARVAEEAAAVAAAVEDDVEAGELPSPARLLALVPSRRQVRVQAPDGRVVEAGRAPPEGDRISASITIDAVRVTVTGPGHDDRVHTFWLAVAAAGAGALVVAAGLAALQARRLARPLERLAEVSRRLGRGDLGARAGAQGVREIDAVAGALDASADRIARLIEHERAFSSHVAHQLRSPLTALDLRLEEIAAHPDPAVREEARAALAQSERLRRTTEDLLALARHGRAGPLEAIDLSALVDDRLAAWAPAVAAEGRRLVRGGGASCGLAHASAGAVEQAIDVLIENALRHGAGTITVAVSDGDGVARLRVADDGPGPDPGQDVFARRDGGNGGIGLPLARALVEAGGGRLTHAPGPPPAFEVALPCAPAGPDP